MCNVGKNVRRGTFSVCVYVCAHACLAYVSHPVNKDINYHVMTSLMTFLAYPYCRNNAVSGNKTPRGRLTLLSMNKDRETSFYLSFISNE